MNSLQRAIDIKKDSVEDIIEKKEGWKPGTKKIFDTALLRKDRKTVLKMLPMVPKAYKQAFSKNISNVI